MSERQQTQPKRQSKSAALYARVSSERQREEGTIGSQIEALLAFAQRQGYTVPPEWIFSDEGYSGATLIRPALERMRDLAAEGTLETVLIFSPDRLSRKYAYQVGLLERVEARGWMSFLFAVGPHAGGAVVASVSRDDRRIRRGSDCGAIAARQAPPTKVRSDHRALLSPLWLALRQANGSLRSLL